MIRKRNNASLRSSVLDPPRGLHFHLQPGPGMVRLVRKFCNLKHVMLHPDLLAFQLSRFAGMMRSLIHIIGHVSSHIPVEPICDDALIDLAE